MTCIMICTTPLIGRMRCVLPRAGQVKEQQQRYPLLVCAYIVQTAAPATTQKQLSSTGGQLPPSAKVSDPKRPCVKVDNIRISRHRPNRRCQGLIRWTSRYTDGRQGLHKGLLSRRPWLRGQLSTCVRGKTVYQVDSKPRSATLPRDIVYYSC